LTFLPILYIMGKSKKEKDKEKTMKHYMLGEDPYLDGLFSDYDWVVSEYQYGSYEGWGELVAYHSGRGILEIHDLFHCSCYGPLEGGNVDRMSVDKYLQSVSIHDTDVESTSLRSKVLELLEGTK